MEEKIKVLEQKILTLESQVDNLSEIINIKVDKDKILEAIDQAKAFQKKFI